jgi:hypothetical protein
MKKLFIAMLLLVSCPVLWAKPMKLETSYGKIFVPEIKDWEMGREMFGMPFIYFSPQVNGERSNISFTATGVDVEGDLTEMGRDFAGYKKMKDAWAAEVLAKPLGYIPYKSWKNAQGHIVHEVGFEFELEGDHYVEKSYYIDCTKRLIFSKTMRNKLNADHDKEFGRMINELDCGAAP